MTDLKEGIDIFIKQPSLMDQEKCASLMNKIVTDSMEKLVSIAPGRKEVSSNLYFMRNPLILANLI